MELRTDPDCCRRYLKALFDVGRHILAKGYGVGISEYREVGRSP